MSSHFYLFGPDKMSIPYGENFVWKVHVREDRALADPDSNEVYIQIYDSADVAKLSAGVLCTRESVGIYSYDYTIPSDGPEGVWLIEFEYTINGATPLQKKNFQVYDKIPFETSEIGLTIGHIKSFFDASDLNDSTIKVHLQGASDYIDSVKVSGADATMVTNAKFYLACKSLLPILAKRSIIDERQLSNFQDQIDFFYDLYMKRVSGSNITQYTPSYAFMRVGKSISTRIGRND